MLPPPMTMADLDAEVVDAPDLVGEMLEHGRLDAVPLLAGQRLAGELQQDPLVPRLRLATHGTVLAATTHRPGSG